MSSYPPAREQFSHWGVDTEAALASLATVPISLHCWQGDDVGGFESRSDSSGGGGIQATGNYPGRARTIRELQADLDLAASLIPGRLRLNLHAIYADFQGRKIERNELTVDSFQVWIQWAGERAWGIDFNPTCFAHPLAADGFTLSNRDPAIRQFWIDHCIASRRIGAAIGQALGTPARHQHLDSRRLQGHPGGPPRAAPAPRTSRSMSSSPPRSMPAGTSTPSRASSSASASSPTPSAPTSSTSATPRARASPSASMQAISIPRNPSATKSPPSCSPSPRLLLHVSRGVRWDSDHVVILDDPTKGILEEVAACNALDRVHVGLDFFDASINRVAAWVIGARNAQKALLLGLLRPLGKLREAENAGDYTARLALMEDARSLPWGAVWDEHCRRNETPADGDWLAGVRDYETRVLSKR